MKTTSLEIATTIFDAIGTDKPAAFCLAGGDCKLSISQLASHIDASQLTGGEAYAFYSDAYRKSKPLESLQAYADRIIDQAGGVDALI